MAAGRMLDVLGALACGVALALAMRSASYELTYGVYIDGLVAEAQRAEIGEPVLDLLRALKYEAPQPKDDAEDDAVELSRAQPEYAWSPWEYLARVVTAERIRLGRVQLARIQPVQRMEGARACAARLGGDLAVETNFGAIGRFPVCARWRAGLFGIGGVWAARDFAALRFCRLATLRPMPARLLGGRDGAHAFIPSSIG